MDLAQSLAASAPLSLAGRTFPVRQLKLREWAEVQAWLKTAYPSPVTQALVAAQEAQDAGVSLSPETVQAMHEAAQAAARRWPPAVASGAWFAAIDGVLGGWSRVVRVVLVAGGTVVPEGEVDDIVAAASLDEIVALARAACHGDHPEPPKTVATTSTPKGPSPTTGGSSSTGSPNTSAGRTRRSAK